MDPTRSYIRRPGARAIFRRCPVGTPGIARDAVVAINDHGLRGRVCTPGDAVRVLVIGGSTAEDALLNDGETWCDQAEALLGPGAWVGNAGRAGCNARHHAIQLERLLDYLPAPHVILVLCGLNDMLADIGAHNAEAEPTLGQCFGVAPELAAPEIVDGGDFAVGVMYRDCKARRRRVRADDWIHAPPADLEQHLARYAESLGRLVDLAGGRLILATQPTLWRPDMSASEQRHLYAGGLGSPDRWFTDDRVRWYGHAVLADLMARYNAVMRTVAAVRGVPCLELSGSLARDPAFYYDDFHFTAAGAHRVAAVVVDGLRARAGAIAA